MKVVFMIGKGEVCPVVNANVVGTIYGCTEWFAKEGADRLFVTPARTIAFTDGDGVENLYERDVPVEHYSMLTSTSHCIPS